MKRFYIKKMVEKMRFLYPETNKYFTETDFKETRLVFLEKPNGYDGAITEMQLVTPGKEKNKSPDSSEVQREKRKWRYTSMAITAYFKEKNIDSPDKFEEKFDFYKYLTWKQKYLHREHNIPVADAITAGEKKLLDDLYDGLDNNGQAIDKRKNLRKKIQDNNKKITQLRREIDELAKTNTPAAKKARNQKVIALDNLSNQNNKWEMDERNISAKLETYMYFMQRHMQIRETSLNMFKQKQENIMKGSVDEYLAKGYDYIMDNWSNMTGGQKFAAFAGITGLIMLISSSKNEDVKKLGTWIKTAGVGLLFYKLTSEGIAPLLSGRNIPENASYWRQKVLKTSVISQAFRKKGEKADAFVKRSEKFIEAFLLLKTKKTPAAEIIKAYYRARDNDHSKKKDKGILNIEGITPGHMNSRDLYLAIKMFFDRYPARNAEGGFEPPLSDPYLKKTPYTSFILHSLARDKNIDLTKDPVSKAWSAIQSTTTKSAHYVYQKSKQAAENLPQTITNVWNDNTKLNQIIPGLGDAKNLLQFALTAPLKVFMKTFEATGIAGAELVKLYNDAKQNGIAKALDRLPRSTAGAIIETLRVNQFSSLASPFGQFNDEMKLKKNYEESFSESEIKQYLFWNSTEAKRGLDQLYLAVTDNNNQIITKRFGDFHYIGIKTSVLNNTPEGRKQLIIQVKNRIAAHIAMNRGKFTGVTGDTAKIAFDLSLRHGSLLTTKSNPDAFLFFRIKV